MIAIDEFMSLTGAKGDSMLPELLGVTLASVGLLAALIAVACMVIRRLTSPPPHQAPIAGSIAELQRRHVDGSVDDEQYSLALHMLAAAEAHAAARRERSMPIVKPAA